MTETLSQSHGGQEATEVMWRGHWIISEAWVWGGSGSQHRGTAGHGAPDPGPQHGLPPKSCPALPHSSTTPAGEAACQLHVSLILLLKCLGNSCAIKFFLCLLIFVAFMNEDVSDKAALKIRTYPYRQSDIHFTDFYVHCCLTKNKIIFLFFRWYVLIHFCKKQLQCS